MKSLLKSLFFLFAIFLIVPAQGQMTLDHVPQKASISDHEKEVAMADAPKAIQSAVKGNQFAGWEATKVTHISKDGKEYYKVEFKKGSETVYHKFMPDGTLKEKKTGKAEKAAKEEKSKS